MRHLQLVHVMDHVMFDNMHVTCAIHGVQAMECRPRSFMLLAVFQRHKAVLQKVGSLSSV